jgi:hypothetical protein
LDGKCNPEATNCCATHLLSLQPDFQEQKSLVQETIEAVGHLCIFLLKFHCELNFIEFFWEQWEHCDYTYDGLRANILKALTSMISPAFNHSEVGVSHDLMDGGIQRG